CELPKRQEAVDVLFTNYQDEFDATFNGKEYDIRPRIILTSLFDKEVQAIRLNEYKNFARIMMDSFTQMKIVKNNTKFEVHFIYDSASKVTVPKAFMPLCINYASYTKEKMQTFINGIEFNQNQKNGLSFFKYPVSDIMKYDLLKNNLCNTKGLKLILLGATTAATFKGKKVIVAPENFNMGVFEFPPNTNYFLYKDVPGVQIV
ncbi:hypothetical protein EBU71_14125, partial [bacterium]|nr:hypothetical protein [Candidatus Elulimicrobium humile]